jgi:hypothetical protein
MAPGEVAAASIFRAPLPLLTTYSCTPNATAPRWLGEPAGRTAGGVTVQITDAAHRREPR